jgi:uncharacterized membrane protein YfcA
MRATTRFLSKFFGLFLIIVALSMLTDPAGMAQTVEAFVHDRAAMLLLGMLCVGGGLATILVHPFWSGGAAPFCVTLLGWMTLAKGVISLCVPSTGMIALAGMIVSTDWYLASGSLTLGLGVFLTYAGFRAPANLSGE